MLLKYRNRNEVDMSNWDIDDNTGTLAHVVWPIERGKLYDIEIKIQREINPWIKENINNDCFYTYETIAQKLISKGYQELVFYFKNVEDAFLFKLTWG